MKIVTVPLPDIGEGVMEGEVVEWLKNEGEPLKQDEAVVVVMTDKATVELPAPYPGLLAKQYFKPGQIAIKGKPLYDIQVEGEAPVLKETAKTFSPAPKAAKPKNLSGKALATPPVRHLAKELGIDLSQVSGSGKEGRVMREDLQRKEMYPAPLSDDEELPLIGVKGLMAKRMAASKRTIPHFSYFESVDAARLLKLKDHAKKTGDKEGLHVTFMPFFIRALSLTIQKYPELNSSFNGQSLLTHKHHNIGIAMSTPQGLIVPVLKEVQELPLEEIIRAFDALKQKAFTSEDMKGSTITISNYGVFGGGGLWATPIINPPEVAILAVNRIQKQPLVKGEQVVVGDVLNLSWSFDHRVIDGDKGAHISHHFANLINNPAQLL